VALGYDRDKADAPVIVAKGERLVAGMIRDLAREARVPVRTDSALAQGAARGGAGRRDSESAFEAWPSCWHWLSTDRSSVPSKVVSSSTQKRRRAEYMSAWLQLATMILLVSRCIGKDELHDCVVEAKWVGQVGGEA